VMIRLGQFLTKLNTQQIHQHWDSAPERRGSEILVRDDEPSRVRLFFSARTRTVRRHGQ
jgi:hypothetical protein